MGYATRAENDNNSPCILLYIAVNFCPCYHRQEEMIWSALDWPPTLTTNTGDNQESLSKCHSEDMAY